MKTFLNRLLLGVAAVTFVLGLVFSPASVQAVAILDFNMDAVHPATASISYAGGIAPLIGKDISVDSVVGIDTPLNSGVQIPFVGILSFTTGNLKSFDADGWLFNGGGSILVKSGSTTLLSGTFGTAEVDKIGGTFKVVLAGFSDEKDADLLTFYGLPTGLVYTGNMNLSFFGTGEPPGAISSTQILSGDITNGKIPEPISLILLGSGLAGAGLYRRLRKPK